MSTNKEIATTIMQQLGGGKFRMMTGAKNFLAIENGLAFQIPQAKSKITKVRIKLNAMDTYDVEFGKIYKHHYIVVAKEEGIYDDMLQKIFTAHTGLDTHL